MSDPSNPTLLDIAHAAGVSTATVSRVLNRPGEVSNKLRQRVETEIRALGYVRHGAARALASSRSFTVGAVIPTLESAIFGSGVNAIENRLEEDDYTLLLAVTNYDTAHESRQVRDLIERGVDGLILVGRDHAPDTLELLVRQSCPFVSTWTYTPDSAHPCIGFDNVSAAASVAGHLLELGHRRFGMIAGITSGNDRARERVTGFRDRLSSDGITLTSLVEKPYAIAAGRDGFREVMDGPAETRPTALFCGNDVLAVGAVIEAGAMGLGVPDDVSVVGFDDLPLAEHLPPGLTTIHVPSRRMGRQAAEYILSRARGEVTGQRIELPTHLVRRGTTAPPPATRR